MEAQSYLNSLLEKTENYILKTTEFRNNFPEFFTQSEDILLGMTQERMAIFYQMSQVINDTQTLFSEVASFIYFCNKIGIGLETKSTYDIKGLGEFIEVYKPFDLDYNITSEGELEVKNEKENKLKFENFSKNIKNLVKSKILTDES